MRKLIAGMRMSLDGKIEGVDGHADWVEAWSDDYDVTRRVDACLLGAGMYPGYEAYWTAVQTGGPDEPLALTGKAPAAGELAWARFAAATPHYVLSTKLASALWPNTEFLRGPDEVAALKGQRGKSIYLVGGARTVAGLIDAGLVDELRLTVYPLLVGPGKALFAATERRRGLELRDVQRLPSGRVSLVYELA